MISFYLLWTLCYLVLLRWFEEKWLAVQSQNIPPEYLPQVTLLISLRNELENLGALALEIRKITYPKLQILLIDDESEDGTFQILSENLKHDPRVRVLRSPGSGKKSALAYGVENAYTELILCTDADCSFPVDWVKQMTQPFSDPKIQLVCGPVLTGKQENYYQRFQQIEWASVLLLTQFFFHQKKPLMCSGANLAYRKSAFLEVKGYDQNFHHWSGDDEFLLKKVVAQFGGESCVYLPFFQNLVSTQPQPNLSALLSQRVRWAGKWRMHRDSVHAFSAVISVLTQLIWIGSMSLLGFGLPGFVAFVVVLIGKFWVEKRALGKVLSRFGLRHSILDFVKTGLLHPLFVLGVGIGVLRGKYVWKGREN